VRDAYARTPLGWPCSGGGFCLSRVFLWRLRRAFFFAFVNLAPMMVFSF
jgi:hypothetical protein